MTHSIDKEKLELAYNDNYINIATPKEVLEVIIDSLKPIESEKKEELCTKCNGDDITKLYCGRCKGSGKEPEEHRSYCNDAVPTPQEEKCKCGCTNKYPHSHLVYGQSCECEKGKPL